MGKNLVKQGGAFVLTKEKDQANILAALLTFGLIIVAMGCVYLT